MSLGKNLRFHRERLGLTLEQLADRSGVELGTISALENRGSSRSKFAGPIAKALGLTLENLLDDSPDSHGKAPLQGGDVVVWNTKDDLPPDPTRIWIDRWDYTCSAGDGGLQWEVRQKDALPFTEAFFKAIRAKPAACKLLMVRGDSMEPFLFNRDMMMVDTSRVSPRDGLIYAVCFEDEPLVKQLFRQEAGALLLHSYNPKYPDRLITSAGMESLKIIGEVVYRSGSGFAAN